MLGRVNVPGKAEHCYSWTRKGAKRGVGCDGEGQGYSWRAPPLQHMFG